MKNLIKKIFSPRNLGAVIAILIVTGATALAQIPAYKSWLIQGTNLYTIGTNVGVGTNNPTSKLHVVGDLRLTGTLLDGSIPWARLTVFPSGCAPGQFVSAVGGTLTCGSPPPGVGGSGTANAIAKFLNPNTLGNSIISELGGNVGIGTANPTVKLDVAGNVRWSGTLSGGSIPWANITGFTGDPTPDTIADDNTITLGVETTGSYDSTPDTIADDGTITLGVETTGSYDSTSDTIADDGVITDGEASDVLTINNGLLFAPTSGNVGIGTTNPGAKLQVTDTNGGLIRLHTAGNNNFAQLETNINNDLIMKTAGNSEKMRIVGEGANSGNVGIGTNNPLSLLQLTAGSGDAKLRFHQAGDTGYSLITGNSAIGLTFQTFPTGGTSAQERLRITNSGNVGIGTTNPLKPLQVGTNLAPSQGIIRVGHNTGVNARLWDLGTGDSTVFGHLDNFGIRDVDMTTAALVINRGTGNVGIGTTNPTATLHVNGNIRANSGLIIYTCPGIQTQGSCSAAQASTCVGHLSLFSTCNYYNSSCNAVIVNCSPIGRMVDL